MKHVRIILALTLGFGLSACGSIDTATRNAPLESAPLSGVAAPEAPAAISVSLDSYSISVPRKLRVSEANMYYPMGDIVWREDPIGDRHQQVAALFETGITTAKAKLDGAMPVKVEIEILRFHALTEKTRYTIGGVHSIKFSMTVRDARSGQIIVPAHHVTADLKGYGGSKAIAAERQGLTQKARITHHLANVIEQELKAPGSTTTDVTQLVAGLETAKQL